MNVSPPSVLTREAAAGGVLLRLFGGLFLMAVLVRHNENRDCRSSTYGDQKYFKNPFDIAAHIYLPAADPPVGTDGGTKKFP